MSDTWGADVPISMPTPTSPSQPPLVDLGDGFVLTAGGISSSLTEAEFEAFVVPTFSPAPTEDS